MTEMTGESVELPFTHKAHVARGVSCLFCHSSALRGPADSTPWKFGSLSKKPLAGRGDRC